MRNPLFVAVSFAIILLPSCRQEQKEQIINPLEREFIAEREGSTPLSKTLRMPDGSVWWSPADEVSVFCAPHFSGGACFVTQNDAPAASVKLRGAFTSAPSDASVFWAVYPYSTANLFDGDNFILTVASSQPAVAGSFADDCFPAIARTTTDKFNFKNLCGGVKFTVSRDDIVSVIFKGNNNEILAGRVTVSLDDAGVPYVQNVVEAVREVQLSSTDGTLTPGEWYYLTMLPTALDEGFTVEFIDKDNNIVQYESNRSNQIKRSVFGAIDRFDKDAVKPFVKIASVAPAKGSVDYHWIEYETGTLSGSADVFSYEGYNVNIAAKNELRPSGKVYGVIERLGVEYVVEPAGFDVDDYQWNLELSDAKRDVRISDVSKKDDGKLVVSFYIYDPYNIDTDTRLYATLHYKNIVESGAEWNSSLPIEVIPSKESLIGFEYPSFSSAEEALACPPQISVPFTGTVEFSPDHLNVSVNSEFNSVKMTDLMSRYGFSMTAEVIPTHIDSAGPAETLFCTVKQNEGGSWVVTPAYPDYNGRVVEVSPDDLLLGSESVGHSPVVVLLLRDSEGRIILANYNKIMIVNDEHADTGERPYGFGSIDFIFNDESRTTQIEEFHNGIKADRNIPLMNQNLGMPYWRFRQLFNCDDKTYVKNNSNRFQKSDQYGTVTYLRVTYGQFSDMFEIDVNPVQAQAIIQETGKAKVLYKRFMNDRGDDVYIGFQVRVDPVYLSFGYHNPAYWFNDVDSNYNTLRASVPFPMHWIAGDYSLNSTITDFSFNILDCWQRQTITLKTSSGVSINNTESIELKWEFANAGNQPRISGKSWTVNSSADELYYSGSPVVHLNQETGVLSYIWDSSPDYISKSLLNKWSATALNLNELLYCKVYLRAYYTYGSDFRTVLGEEVMNVRFLRPLDMEIIADSYLTDGLPGVDFVRTGDLFRLKGLAMNYQLFEKSDDSFRVCRYPKPENFQVDLYGYMGIEKMSLDLSNLKTDQNGYKELLSTANPAAKVWLATKDDLYNMLDSSEIDITNVESLGNYVICYANNMPSQVNFSLYIPISITYAWGVITGELTVPVKTASF